MRREIPRDRHLEVPAAVSEQHGAQRDRYLGIPPACTAVALEGGMSRIATLASLVSLLWACSGSHAAPDAAVPDTPAPDAPPDACIAPAAATPVDCVAGACAVIDIAGEMALPAQGFRGYADASLRNDPGSDRVWMGYSFVQPVQVDDGKGGTLTAIQVASHLAHTDDRGDTWTFDAVPFPATAAPAGGNVTGFFNSETISLAPVSATSWFASRLAYLSETSPEQKLVVSTFMVRISHATAPDQLGRSPEQVIGLTSSLPAGFGATTDLNTLSGLSCTYWNDPGLFYHSGTLYLTAECVGQGTIHVFAATATDDVTKLVWTDRGALTTPADAAALGDTELNQADLEEAADGTLLLTVTPSHVVPGQTLSAHEGCRSLVIDSLDPPRLHRDCGQLAVRAQVTASDVPSTGSCGYDAHAGVGLVLARRPDGSRPGLLVRSRVP
jgi:hypothetical protein